MSLSRVTLFVSLWLASHVVTPLAAQSDPRDPCVTNHQTRLNTLENETIPELRRNARGDLDRLQTDRFWVLLAAVLVFFMQSGFKCLEVGLVGTRLDGIQAGQKLFSWIGTYIGYFPIGFGIMFGASYLGIWGQPPYWPSDLVDAANRAIGAANQAVGLPAGNPVRGLEFFLFQAAFAATAVTIPAGATAGRMSLKAYILVAIFIAALVYPVFGHWAWGGSIYTDAVWKQQLPAQVPGWLRGLGFHDFAGSTVVHSVGGWCALIAAIFVGPRPGRFDRNGRVNTGAFPSRSRGYAILGVFMLWFGWWGFNGGSQLAFDFSVSRIILNTNLAGAAAGLGSYLFAYLENVLPWGWFQKGMVADKTIGGTLGGLVAITASCDRTTALQAIVIGFSAGIIQNLVVNLLLKFQVDDPVGAFPVHAGCGIWGTWCVAITYSAVGKQFAVQLLGTIVAFAWTVGVALVIFSAAKRLEWMDLEF